MGPLLLLAILVVGGSLATFFSPRHAYRNGALALIAAFAAPYLLGFLIQGDLNLGGPVLAYGSFAVFALVALCLFLGATARHAWNALRQ